MIYDICTYNGEKDLFDLRYNILKDYVDEFIVVEFDKTFSGKDKQPYFPQDFKNLDKVSWCVFTENHWKQYKELAESSPNTVGADHWKTEFMMKESIKDALIHLKDDDIVFIGDCDEIWNPELASGDTNGVIKLKLKVYAYYLNNRSSEIFWGTIVGKYKNIKDKCLNHLRSRDYFRATEPELGWHFTSMAKDLERKLTDSYTSDSYASPEIMSNLQENIKNNKDFIGRNLTFKTDESDWPTYLKDNREKYGHLLNNS